MLRSQLKALQEDRGDVALAETVKGTMMRNGVKNGIKWAASFIPTPGWTRRYPHLNRLEKWKVDVLCGMLLHETGGMVFGGPFATMKLDSNLALGRDPRFIVGSYEQEVHDVINDVIVAAPINIVDIGSAFGYYAVGFAAKIAHTRITAFEAVEEPHWRQLRDLARLNGVSEKIVQRGLCTPSDLEEVCSAGSFILSDCEGAEEQLCDPRRISALGSCTMLIELHEFNATQLVATLVERFRHSHNIRIIEEAPRDPSLYRILKRLPPSWRPIAIEEAKWAGDTPPYMATWLRFLFLTPKQSSRQQWL
jgi:hypothetical protein